MRTPSILFNWLRRITRTRSNNSSLKSHRSWRTVHPRNTRPINNFALVSLVIANDQQNIATFSGPSIRIISYFFRNGNCFSPHHKPPMDNSNRAQYPSSPPLYSLSLSLSLWLSRRVTYDLVDSFPDHRLGLSPSYLYRTLVCFKFKILVGCVVSWEIGEVCEFRFPGLGFESGRRAATRRIRVDIKGLP